MLMKALLSLIVGGWPRYIEKERGPDLTCQLHFNNEKFPTLLHRQHH